MQIFGSRIEFVLWSSSDTRFCAPFLIQWHELTSTTFVVLVTNSIQLLLFISQSYRTPTWPGVTSYKLCIH
jgi:hypothetical protein